jgi:3-methyl-2-oxobutanoate hydroxymethyltransferase
MSYEFSVQEAVKNAGRLVKEAGVDAVKLEGGAYVAEAARAICQAGIPVHGHIGLTPQKIKQIGGFKTQGKTLESAVTLFKDALALAQAGCFAITLECTPPVLGKMITQRLKSIIIIGVGAGPYCDGQSMNLYDLIGLTQGIVPKFAKRYASVAEIVKKSIADYCGDVAAGSYPDKDHSYQIDEETEVSIRKTLEAIPE